MTQKVPGFHSLTYLVSVAKYSRRRKSSMKKGNNRLSMGQEPGTVLNVGIIVWIFIPIALQIRHSKVSNLLVKKFEGSKVRG